MMLYIIPKFNMTLCKIVMRLLMQILLKYVSSNPRSFPLKKKMKMYVKKIDLK